MAEVTVSPAAKETIITLGDGTVVSATISQETLSVVSEKQDPIVLDLNTGPRGQPGSSILVGEGYPLMSQGSIGDIFLSTGGVNVGSVFIKTETAWVENGNVRGPAGGIESVNGDFGPGVLLDADDIGLTMVDNTSDADKPVSIATQTALNLKANASDTVNLTGAQTIAGIKTFSSAPVVPDSSWSIAKTNGLQAAIDSANNTAVKLTGNQTITGDKTFSNSIIATIVRTPGLILDSNGDHGYITFRSRDATPTTRTAWIGVGSAASTVFAITNEMTNGGINLTPNGTGVVNVTSGTLQEQGQRVYSPNNNPTKANVGLGNVDNTSDANKPVSTATQTALNLKANLASPTFTGTVSGITAAMVTNAADTNTAQNITAVKTFTVSPIVPTPTTGTQASTKQYVDDQILVLTNGSPALLNTLDELAAALGDDANFATTMTNNLALKAPLASPTFTGTVSGITKAMVGLANVDNTADTAKPVSTAQQTALNLKVNLAGAETITGLKTFSAGLAATTITATGNLTLNGAGNNGIEIGRTDNVASQNFIDFHTGTTGSNDYDARILVSGGGATPGQANMSIIASSGITFTGALIVNSGLSSTGTITAGSFSGSGNGLTALPVGSLQGTIAQANLVVNTTRVVHGATAGTARPTGATYVEWIGSVTPTNMAANDTWINTGTSGTQTDMFPAGMVVSSASAKPAAQSGWYFIEGQQVLISGDTNLYNEITNNGTVFPYGANTNGAGAAGSTHFRLPDGRGRVIVHADGTTEFAAVGTIHGVKSVTMSNLNLPLHNHGVSDPGHLHDFYNNTTTWTWNANMANDEEDIWIMGGDASAGKATSNQIVTNSGFSTTVPGGTTGISIQNAGYASPTPLNNIQPSLTMRYMIKR